MNHLGVLRHILEHPLNRGRAGQALRDYVRWQLGSRLVPGDVAVPFVNDAVLLVRPGMHGATQNVYCGLADFADMGFLLHLLRPGDCFADVGANVGTYTVLASAAIGARSIAFEPNPETFPSLMRNIHANGIESRVTALRSGAGSKAGMHSFEPNGTQTRVAIADGRGCGVFESPVVPLNQALADSTPALIKMDVEGFESDVLAGAGEILPRPGLLALIVENNEQCLRFGFELDKAHKMLVAEGFRAASYDPFRRQLTSLDGLNPISQNSIYVRDLHAVEDRLKTAAPFRVKGQSL